MTTAPVSNEERRFLVTPLEGFSDGVDSGTERILEDGFRQLVAHQDVAAARSAAESLLRRDSDLAPALVLAGQADLVDDAVASAQRQAEQAVAEYPEYVAGLLLLARSAERSGDIVTAYATYEQVAARRVVAGERAGELKERALEIQGHRVAEALARQRVDVARAEYDRLSGWAPDEERTLELGFEIARAEDDFEGQLATTRSLVERRPDDPLWRERLGELEMRGGDAMKALEMFEGLREQYPAEPRYVDALDRATFVWRLRNLPAKVAETAAKPELTRGDFAVLLYWLAPGVRAGGAAHPKIATDILDHPQRQEIIRVVNLGLLNLDGSVREFRPDESLQRVEALRALLLALRRSQPSPACLNGVGSLVAWETVCNLSAACGVLASQLECLPSAPLSGQEALDWLRRSLTY